ncbi:MAG: prolyl oligopeptidase family serine peptidase, partial [Gemmataceae bacterium]
EKNPVKARVFTKLFFRHWDEYVAGTRQHLFVMSAPNGTSLEEPRDVTPGDRDGYPTSMTFSVGDDFTFSPDGKFLLYTAPPEKEEAWNTNHDIWRVNLASGERENMTADNRAADGYPQFSSDGKWLAYRAQARPGFEADRWQLFVAPARPDGSCSDKPKSLTEKFDSSVNQFVWAGDGKSIVFDAEDRGLSPIYRINIAMPEVSAIYKEHSNYSLSTCRSGKIAFGQSSLLFPTRVMVLEKDKARLAADGGNGALLKEIGLPAFESIDVKGAEGTPMQMWLLKPPGFDAGKKWPLVYLVHGGPQGSWNDGWSWRWNPALWAAQGYVVALPNPRGSTGFGQKYVDDISKDWGGKVFEDLMKGMDYLEGLPYIDKDRVAAAGASYGGYMMNFFQGNTARFKTLITHCGVYNLESMFATTEELWFAEWELGGLPWDEKAESYKKFSPHRFAKNFKTPMLIIHGDLDFRVPVSQGLELFTTLQRLGIASKMINFPDEGHWVSKPANSKYWHEQVFAWLKKYAPPGGK